MIETIHWHTLHPRYLNADSTVIDLGANYGQFAHAIVKRFGCRCIAVEPSPVPFAAIPDNSTISKLRAAVADRSGTMLFHIAPESVASSLVRGTPGGSTISVRVLSLSDLLDHLGLSHVDLLKVDIEGAEISMFDACPDTVLRRIAQMAIEFHDFCGMTPVADVKRLLSRLRRLGFFAVRMSGVGHQDTWLINRRLLPIGTTELLFTRHVVRNWAGLKRVLARKAAAHWERP